MTPVITYGKNNLWFFNGLMHLIPVPKTPEGMHVENVYIPDQDDQTKIRLRIYKSKMAAVQTPVLIWLHGGGFVMGRPEQDEVRSCGMLVNLASS